MDGIKPVRQLQRRFNPPMMDVVKAEFLKLLQANIIFLISNSEWVSPTQVILKNSGVTVVRYNGGELVPTRVQKGWRVCKDYCHLNAVTRKDYFSLVFIDQILEWLANQEFYYVLDGYSEHLQVPLHRTISIKLLLHVHLAHMHIDKCGLACAVHSLHFNSV